MDAPEEIDYGELPDIKPDSAYPTPEELQGTNKSPPKLEDIVITKKLKPIRTPSAGADIQHRLKDTYISRFEKAFAALGADSSSLPGPSHHTTLAYQASAPMTTPEDPQLVQTTPARSPRPRREVRRSPRRSPPRKACVTKGKGKARRRPSPREFQARASRPVLPAMAETLRDVTNLSPEAAERELRRVKGFHPIRWKEIVVQLGETMERNLTNMDKLDDRLRHQEAKSTTMVTTWSHEMQQLAANVARVRLEMKQDVGKINAQLRWVLEALDDERSRRIQAEGPKRRKLS